MKMARFQLQDFNEHYCKLFVGFKLLEILHHLY